MTATTILMDYELNVPTPDEDVNEVLREARELTGKDWQVVVRNHSDKRLFSSPRLFQSWQLCVYVGGCFPYQAIMCATERDTIFAYLAGVVSGASK